MNPRCQHCAEPLPVLARRHAKFCSGRCRVAAHRARHRQPIPLELRSRDRWVCHTDHKVPIRPSGRPASSTNATTWRTFDQVTAARRPGIGFVLNGDGVICIDLDHCLNGDTLEPWAQRILDSTPATYVEVSPSGTGLHIWGYGSVPRGRRTPRGEVYGTGRYITVTGKSFRNAPARLTDISALADSI